MGLAMSNLVYILILSNGEQFSFLKVRGFSSRSYYHLVGKSRRQDIDQTLLKCFSGLKMTKYTYIYSQWGIQELSFLVEDDQGQNINTRWNLWKEKKNC
jgi:hypothetical protein